MRQRDGAERHYPLDGPHEDAAVSRNGRTAHVTGGFTRDGFWNGLAVIDLAVIDLDSGDTHRLTATERR
ncbi:hypothetical protein [Streptomyces gossypii]|uniref:hypothetical protein n=1 Tax=Streptomyces gossypii TaxID=2883101 RepID=UPI0035CD07BC